MDDACLNKIVCIANVCINLKFWPSYFKTTTTVVIPKPNKDSYNMPKSFQSIVLLNTTGKLIEKAISNYLQFYMTVRDVRSGSGVTRNGAELLRSGRELTTKVKEQPWPQLLRCASIDCRVCGCIFQED